MDLKTIFTYTRDDFQYISDRLKEIRLELKAQYAETHKGKGKNPYDRDSIASVLGVHRYTITNTESKGFSHNSLKLIHLYYSYGYNSNWILIKENDFINKKLMQENIVLKSNVQQGYREMRENMIAELDKYKNML